MGMVTFYVSSDDIVRGEAGNCLNCALALAVRRALPGARVVVWGARVEVNGRRYGLPAYVRKWIENYDDVYTARRTEPQPIALVLEIEDGVRVAESVVAA